MQTVLTKVDTQVSQFKGSTLKGKVGGGGNAGGGEDTEKVSCTTNVVVVMSVVVVTLTQRLVHDKRDV